MEGGDDQMAAFMALQMDEGDNCAQLPLLVADDIMWGGATAPSNRRHARSGRNSATSCLAELLVNTNSNICQNGGKRTKLLDNNRNSQKPATVFCTDLVTNNNLFFLFLDAKWPLLSDSLDVADDKGGGEEDEDDVEMTERPSAVNKRSCSYENGRSSKRLRFELKQKQQQQQQQQSAPPRQMQQQSELLQQLMSNNGSNSRSKSCRQKSSSADDDGGGGWRFSGKGGGRNAEPGESVLMNLLVSGFDIRAGYICLAPPTKKKVK